MMGNALMDYDHRIEAMTSPMLMSITEVGNWDFSKHRRQRWSLMASPVLSLLYSVI